MWLKKYRRQFGSQAVWRRKFCWLTVALMLASNCAYPLVGAAAANNHDWENAAQLQEQSSRLENRLAVINLSENLVCQQQPLQEVLDKLAAQTGVRLVAVPAIGVMPVNLTVVAGSSLQAALDQLNADYRLELSVNSQENAIVLFPGQYNERVRKNSRQELANQEMLPVGQRQSLLLMKADNTVNAPSGSSNYSASIPGAWNTEEYKYQADNRFLAAESSPLSTFSIDVDTASYSNLRRFLNAGQLPPVDAVRTEELLNYFNYAYPQPTGAEPFTVTAEVGPCPWNQEHQLALLGLQGKNLPANDLPPSNLVFLLDVSGSMNQPNKLPLLKTAFKLLTAQLRAQDRVAIVVYAGSSGTALESTAGNEQEKILAVLAKLQAGGSTAGGEGIKRAYQLAKANFLPGGNNRVILATDGDFNVGVSSEGELTRLIETYRQENIYLTVLGFGMGNIKDSKMETLAAQGNGNYAYIDNALEAQKVLVSQFAGTMYTIAKDVKLQLEFNPATVQSYRLLGYENRLLHKEDFNDEQKDAGDLGAGQAVTALYELVPAKGTADAVSGATAKVDKLAYQQTKLLASQDLFTVKVRYKLPTAANSQLFTLAVQANPANLVQSTDFCFAAAVAEYAMLLRKSEFKGQASYKQLLELAAKAKGADLNGYRAEFLRLAEISQLLGGTQTN